MTADLDVVGMLVHHRHNWVKFEGQVTDQIFLFTTIGARYDVTYFWLFVQFFVLKWPVRPLTTAF